MSDTVVQSGCLFVGEGVTVKGSFSVPNIATVAGILEGDISAHQVNISETGFIKGSVRAEVVHVLGELHDSLVANKSLFIRSTGSVIGDVKYVEIEIEKNGVLQGQIEKINRVESEQAQPMEPFTPTPDEV